MLLSVIQQGALPRKTGVFRKGRQADQGMYKLHISASATELWQGDTGVETNVFFLTVFSDIHIIEYVLILLAVVFMTVAIVLLTYHVVLLYIYAIAISSLYFSKN